MEPVQRQARADHGTGPGDEARGVPAPAPAPVVAGLPAKVYFDVGSALIGAEGGNVIAAAADLLRKDGLKVSVTGYTDRTGDTAKNEELSKQRAAAVRDALKAAG